METKTAQCQHCGRDIALVNGQWMDPNATGDDVVWRETCDSHDTFTAEHEPATGCFSCGLPRGEHTVASRARARVEGREEACLVAWVAFSGTAR